MAVSQKKIKIELLYDPAILLLDIYSYALLLFLLWWNQKGAKLLPKVVRNVNVVNSLRN